MSDAPETSDDAERAAQIAGCRESLQRVVDVNCRSGIYDAQVLRSSLEDILENELEEADAEPLLTEYAAAVERALAAQDALEATWTERTLNDDLDSAFEDLNARGILALQAVGWDKGDGWATAALHAEEHGLSPRGCVFYHRQTLEGFVGQERAIEGNGLVLVFGVWDADAERDAAAAISIGREVVRVLGHHGVETVWNGSHVQAIQIPPFVWKKRRVTQAPAGRSAAPLKTPPPPPPCPLCKGRGWVASADPSAFPETCACRRGGVG